MDACFFGVCVCVFLLLHFWTDHQFLKIWDPMPGSRIFFTSQKRPPPGRTEILTTQCVVESEPPANVEDEEPESKKSTKEFELLGRALVLVVVF